MKKILDILTDEFKNAFVKCGYDENLGKVTLSNRPDLCEYQCNGAMAGAKAYKKAPIMIANEVVDCLKDNDIFESIEAVMPGFINIKISPIFLADYINKMAEDDKLGSGSENTKTIVVDYGGPNVAKSLHVGHLRSAVIGESVKRICRFMGHKVVGDAHLGDWGLQMGLIITELKERQPELVYFDPDYTGEYPTEPPFTLDDLEKIYPEASAKSKEDEEYKAAAHDAVIKIQQGYPPYQALWKHIMDISVPDLKRNYKNLDVDFDLWNGESDSKPYIQGLWDTLTEKNLAYESQGALVVDVAEESDKKEIPPCIVRKSDGAALYATSDLATIIQREKEINPDEYIYLADKRQELHFTQVFRVAKKAQIVSDDKKMNFIGFGTMNGKDGKPFKTREGGVMRLEHLIANINDAVYDKIMENRSVSEDEARKTAQIVGLSALKYGDLSNHASKDYIFDIDRFTSFEGNTGPYILYTIVRIKSILEKYVENGGDVNNTGAVLEAKDESQKSLMLEMAKFNEVMESACEELAPHKICAYIYDLSNAFNHFYHETRILAEEDETVKAGYISLLKVTKRVLETCIDLLGFSAPDKM